MKSALKENISPFPQWLTSKHVALTLGELEIAHLVKEGKGQGHCTGLKFIGQNH